MSPTQSHSRLSYGLYLWAYMPIFDPFNANGVLICITDSLVFQGKKNNLTRSPMSITYKNLVFRGGGVKGIAYAGAIDVLNEKGLYDGIERVAGVSAGAITSLLVGLRYTPADIQKVLSETSFADFMDSPNAARVLTRYGYYKGEFALNWLHELVAKSPLGLDKNATFADLKKAGGRDLYMFTTDVNSHSSVELSERKTPNTMIAEAARASMSIPMFFEAFQFSNSQPNDHLYVDGGMVYNYPMSIFDQPEFLPAGQTVNQETLGFYFVPPKDAPPVLHEFGYDHIIKFVVNNVETIMMTQVIDFHRDPTDVERTVQVSDCGVSATDFNLTQEQQKELVNSGKTSTAQFLQEKGV